MAVLMGLSFGTGIEKKMKTLFENSTPPEAVVVSAKTDEDNEETLLPENIVKQMLDINENDDLTKDEANKLLHKNLTIVKEDTVAGEVKRKEYNIMLRLQELLKQSQDLLT